MIQQTQLPYPYYIRIPIRSGKIPLSSPHITSLTADGGLRPIIQVQEQYRGSELDFVLA
jgi:hypothetical protein